jgi:hypothetical protein
MRRLTLDGLSLDTVSKIHRACDQRIASKLPEDAQHNGVERGCRLESSQRATDKPTLLSRRVCGQF